MMKFALAATMAVPGSLTGQEASTVLRIGVAYTRAFEADGAAVVFTLVPGALRFGVERRVSARAGLQVWAGRGSVASVDFNSRTLWGIGANFGGTWRPTGGGFGISLSASPQYLHSDPGSVLYTGEGCCLPPHEDTEDGGFALGLEGGLQLGVSRSLDLTTDLTWLSHRLYDGNQPGIWRFGVGMEFRP